MALKRKLDKQWKEWLRTNLAAGCDKNGLFKILLDNGFDYKTIRKQMKFEPQVPVTMLRNPLTERSRRTTVELNQKQEPLDWSELYIANAHQTHQGLCGLQQLDHFLTEEEQRKITEEVQSLFAQPQTASPNKPERLTLGNDWLQEKSALHALEQRIIHLMGFHPSYADDLQAVRFPACPAGPNPEALQLEPEKTRQLAHTLIIGLSGASSIKLKMSNLQETLEGQDGSLMVWSYPSTGLENLPMQELLPVHEEESPTLLLVKNFYRTSHLKPAPRMYIKEANEYIRSITQTGFVKTQLPGALFSKIKDFYDKNRTKHATETIAGGFVYNAVDQKKQSSALVHLDDTLKKEIHDTILPMVAEWCGKDLEPSYVYGIRVYRDQAVLKLHRDRIETHVLGVIINVDQEVNEDWPLMIDDHSYRQHQIFLKPGDMVFYESARLRHGRPQPFNGESFANIFCHLRPKDYILRK